MSSMDVREFRAPATEMHDGGLMSLALVKPAEDTGAETKLQHLQPYSRSSVEVLFAVLDDDRTNEREEMVQLNKHLTDISGRVHLMESETVFIEIISNIKDFGKLFENLTIGERTEIERLKWKVKTIETEKSTLSENLAVEKSQTKELTTTIEQLKLIVEKTNKEMSLLREDYRNLQVENTKLTERLQAEERRVKNLEEELEYTRKTIDTKNQEIRKILGGVSGLSILVSWETKLKGAITDIRKQYQEQLKNIQASYEQRMDIEISEIRIKIKKMIDDRQDGCLKEIENYQNEISYLKGQLESKNRYIEVLTIDYGKYKKWSEDKLREFEADLGRVAISIRRYNQKDFSLKSEIDSYRYSLEELEKRIAGIKSFFATVRVQAGLTVEKTTRITDYIPGMDEPHAGPPFPRLIGPAMSESLMDDNETEEKNEDF